MSAPELSSKRKIKSVPLESEKNPNGVPNGTRDGYGMGRGSGSKNVSKVVVRTPMRVVYARELAWAEQHLPGEYGPFVALAIESLKRRGVAPSTKSVLGHLSALGRDAASRGGV